MRNNSGFTLIKLVVVIAILGILSAIAAPVWLDFLSQRRTSAVQGEIIQALQAAQNEAKRTKRTTAVEFNAGSDPPLVAVNGNWQTLGQGEIRTGQIQLSSSSSTFSFNYKGEPVKGQSLPFKARISAPGNGSSSRCVLVETLFGVIREARGTACD